MKKSEYYNQYINEFFICPGCRKPVYSKEELLALYYNENPDIIKPTYCIECGHYIGDMVDIIMEEIDDNGTIRSGNVVYITPLEAARLLKVTRRTIYRWIDEGNMVCKKFQRAVRIPLTEIYKHNIYLKGNSQNGDNTDI